MDVKLFFRFPLQLENGQTVECTVAKYFLDKYKMKLRYCCYSFTLVVLFLKDDVECNLVDEKCSSSSRYPHFPCLQVGQEHKHTYLPLEVKLPNDIL